MSEQDLHQLISNLSPIARFRLLHLLQPCTPDLLLVLPTELQKLIFAKLDAPSLAKCERVCKVWNAIVVGAGREERHYDAWKCLLPADKRDDKAKERAIEQYLADQRWSKGKWKRKHWLSQFMGSFAGLKLLDLKELGGSQPGYAVVAVSPQQRTMRAEIITLNGDLESGGNFIDVEVNNSSCLDARVLKQPWEFRRFQESGGDTKEYVMVKAMVAVGHTDGKLSMWSLSVRNDKPSFEYLATFGNASTMVLHTAVISACRVLGTKNQVLTISSDGVICSLSFRKAKNGPMVVDMNKAMLPPSSSYFPASPHSPRFNFAISEELDLGIVATSFGSSYLSFSISNFPRMKAIAWANPSDDGLHLFNGDAKGQHISAIDRKSGLAIWRVLPPSQWPIYLDKQSLGEIPSTFDFALPKVLNIEWLEGNKISSNRTMALGILENRVLMVDASSKITWLRLPTVETQTQKRTIDGGSFELETHGAFFPGPLFDAITVKDGLKETSVVAVGSGASWRHDRGGVVLLEI